MLGEFFIENVYRTSMRPGPVLTGRLVGEVSVGDTLTFGGHSLGGCMRVLAVDVGTSQSIEEGTVAIVVTPDPGDRLASGVTLLVAPPNSPA